MHGSSLASSVLVNNAVQRELGEYRGGWEGPGMWCLGSQEGGGERPAQLLRDTDGCRVVGREALQAPQERAGPH